MVVSTSQASVEPIYITSITTDEAPVVDGNHDDPVWQRVHPLGELRQVTPVAGAALTAVTELRMVQDGATLYVAVTAHELPGYQRVARQTRRDSLLDGDDHITLVLDPAHGGRNGYLFRINANGAQFDALIFDSAELREDWDAIWDVRVQSGDFGWYAEFAIPLNALTANSGGRWGLNVERYLAVTGERQRWRGAQPDREVTALRIAGAVDGMPTQAAGRGLRIKPSLRLNQNDRSGEREAMLEPGLDLFWRMRPDTTATLTLNSDFAEAEADDRQVNLTRYPLLLPEKREFFLQDAGVFSFGGLVDNVLPFFSRRVGLAPDGTPLALDAGLKLSHESHAVDAGLLVTRVEEGPTTDAVDIGVGRVALRTGDYTRLGVIGTMGDPTGISGSSLWGVDWQYRNPQFLTDRNLSIDLWTQTSHTAAAGSASAQGGVVDLYNIGWLGNLGLQRIDLAFDPALGFITETGVEVAFGTVGYWWHTDMGGEIVPAMDWEWRGGMEDARAYRQLNPEIELQNARGDYVMPELFFERETLIEAFEIVPGLVIPAGDYRYDSAIIYAGMGAHRPLSGEASLRWGEFYDGRREDYTLSSALRPASTWGITLRGQQTDLHLAAGDARIHLVALGFDLTPTPRIATSVLAQWDSISDEIGLSLRLRWTLAPGQDIYVSINRLLRNDSGFTTTARDDGIKVAWNWMY